MGWWKVQGTDNSIGDGPLDALGGAVMSVIAEYEASFSRRPTKAEWEALLLAVSGAEEPDERVLDDGVVRGVQLESSQPQGG
jgi:hypothetical protein